MLNEEKQEPWFGKMQQAQRQQQQTTCKMRWTPSGLSLAETKRTSAAHPPFLSLHSTRAGDSCLFGCLLFCIIAYLLLADSVNLSVSKLFFFLYVVHPHEKKRGCRQWIYPSLLHPILPHLNQTRTAEVSAKNATHEKTTQKNLPRKLTNGPPSLAFQIVRRRRPSSSPTKPASQILGTVSPPPLLPPSKPLLFVSFSWLLRNRIYFFLLVSIDVCHHWSNLFFLFSKWDNGGDGERNVDYAVNKTTKKKVQRSPNGQSA